MSVIYAEVEHLIRSDVQIDVARFCAANADDRKTFGGTDEEYVRYCIEQDRYEYMTSQSDDGGMGVSVTEEYDEIEVRFLS